MTARSLLAGLAAAGLASALGLSAEPASAGPALERQANRCDQPGPYDLPQGSERVDLQAKDFSTRIDHPYWPMRPGTTWHYVERGGGEVAHVRTTVTHRTKMIDGIRARVVHDVASVDDEVVEDTRDWYAQDSGGNLWYLGENSKTYEDGELVTTEGSWQHGRDGGQAGVILPARARPGCRYREEFLPGEAEDRAEILSTRESLRTPTGFYSRVLHTANTTALEPDVLENKFYARGVGPVLELDLSPEFGRAVLVRVTSP
jgi:hypothetical protein